MYTSILERAWGGIEKETRHVTVVCAHHDVPALAETLITSYHCGNHLHSDWQVHTTYYYRRIEGRELGRQEPVVSSRYVRRVLLPHTIAALSNSRIYSTFSSRNVRNL